MGLGDTTKPFNIFKIIKEVTIDCADITEVNLSEFVGVSKIKLINNDGVKIIIDKKLEHLNTIETDGQITMNIKDYGLLFGDVITFRHNMD